MFPPGGGYATFLHGKVVDMLYFPILHGNYPSWVPFLGRRGFPFFRPVFNIADSSITIGVLTLVIFQKKFFRKNGPVAICSSRQFTASLFTLTLSVRPILSVVVGLILFMAQISLTEVWYLRASRPRVSPLRILW